jgi:hypothetical protein
MQRPPQQIATDAGCEQGNSPTRNQKSRRLFCPTSQGRRAEIFFFPKYGIYDLKKPSRLDTRDVMAIRHQT